METETLIWIIVAIVVALLVLGLAAALWSRKQKERRSAQAAQLRREAQARGPDLDEADVRARAARVEADRARVEAQQADAKAREAEQARSMEEAEYEDRIREADRLDPSVDHTSDAYQPPPEKQASTPRHPPGSAYNEDGTVVYPDGTLHNPDGKPIGPPPGAHRDS
jgi:FtsZ-interacting cell division protein ZipA